MHYHRRQGWEISERLVTPESLSIGRRAVLGGTAAAIVLSRHAHAAVPRNPKYDPGRSITPEGDVENYNNFYEFGTDKDIADDAQALKTSPWSV